MLMLKNTQWIECKQKLTENICKLLISLMWITTCIILILKHIFVVFKNYRILYLINQTIYADF